MGMYTEIVAGFSLKEDTPEDVIKVLRYIIEGEGAFDGALPDHLLFTKDRWRMLARCGSYYFGFSESNSAMVWDHNGYWIVSIRASIKNYDGEIEAFFDWIGPYVDSGSGSRNMLGYSIYEGGDEPTIYYLDAKLREEDN